jgi:predicted NBD/HSP70 family sugar kinase
MKTLVIDIGGTNVKVWKTDQADKLRFPSGPELTPEQMVSGVRKVLGDWKYDRVSIGYPGKVLNGMPVEEPFNLGSGWVGFDYEHAFDRPTRIMNDAAMQALGVYDGGRMLQLGLGTSVGTVLVVDWHLIPLSLGHLPIDERGTLEAQLNRRALEKRGFKRWHRAVARATKILREAFLADYVVLGGGNVKKLQRLPEGCRRGGNEYAFFGGLRMWEHGETSTACPIPAPRAAAEPPSTDSIGDDSAPSVPMRVES